MHPVNPHPVAHHQFTDHSNHTLIKSTPIRRTLSIPTGDEPVQKISVIEEFNPAISFCRKYPLCGSLVSQTEWTHEKCAPDQYL